MGRINSKAKGSKNERDVCKWWKDWTGYEFSRVPSSGGLRWSRTTDTTGDILCSDQKHYLRFPFSIECKNYKDINFEHILLGNKNVKVLQFWEQAVGDAERGGKLPILMMRYNGMKKGDYFFVVSETIGALLVRNMPPNDVNVMLVNAGNTKLIIAMASDIAKYNDYKEIYKLSKKILKSKK